MKVLILISMALATLAASQVAQAQALQNGRYYDPSGSSCALVVENNQQTGGFVLTTGDRNCQTITQNFEPSSVQGKFTANLDPIKVDHKMIAGCLPTDVVKYPCDKRYYDAHSGALLLRAGDVIQETIEISILNSTSFEDYTADSTKVMRGNQVVLHFTGDVDTTLFVLDTSIASDDSGASSVSVSASVDTTAKAVAY